MEYEGRNETKHKAFVGQECCVLFPLKGINQEEMW